MNLKTLTVLGLSALLFACSKEPPAAEAPSAPPAVSQATGAAPSTASADAPQPTRAATYNPKLTATEIVWDSPEKKKVWEERQRQIKQNQKTDK